MSAETAPAPVPQLRFRLTGTWVRVIEDHGHTSGADSLARLVLGSADDLAQARMLIKRQVREGAQLALDGGATAMFIARELDADTPLAATLTVYQRPDLRMSPAIGTAPAAVIDMLAANLDAVGMPGAETAVRLDLDGFCALRTHTNVSEDVDETLPGIATRNLSVNYWCTVPETKQMVLVTFQTPMGVIEQTMLRFFDATMQAARYR